MKIPRSRVLLASAVLRTRLPARPRRFQRSAECPLHTVFHRHPQLGQPLLVAMFSSLFSRKNNFRCSRSLLLKELTLNRDTGISYSPRHHAGRHTRNCWPRRFQQHRVPGKSSWSCLFESPRSGFWAAMQLASLSSANLRRTVWPRGT